MQGEKISAEHQDGVALKFPFCDIGIHVTIIIVTVHLIQNMLHLCGY